ncbi:hypothetical protein PG991_012175 [Apiospora marii]|uniref:SET domain-containing protein n=1 Tax=Apiospora marii TaxID=335849 RepID=A0ABR1R925_9PEZI
MNNPRAPINPHPVGLKRRFEYRLANRKKKLVGRNTGANSEKPIFVTDHVISRGRGPGYRLYRPPPPPRPAPLQADGSAPRRSARVAAQAVGAPAAAVAQAGHAAAQAQVAQAAQGQAAQAQVFAAGQQQAAQIQAAQAALVPVPAGPVLPSQSTLDVQAVLSYNIDGFTCEICQLFPDQCDGEACYAEFLRTDARDAARSVEVRQTLGPMGFGLYVKPGHTLDPGECLGELVPASGRGSGIPDPSYTFNLGGESPPNNAKKAAANKSANDANNSRYAAIAQIDARVHGNYTRFVNHHCRPNAIARHVVIGRRHMVIFRARRQLRAGEQIFVSYGAGYFQNRRCPCDAEAGPHRPAR